VKIFDTLTRQPQDVLGDEGVVRMYVCGGTPYDTTHLGHARTFLVYDVLVRRLMALGARVRHVRNVTDVDDSILAKARAVGEPYLELAERYLRIFDDDMRALNALPPDVVPRATGEIPQMIRLVERILERGHGYVRDGTVYFRAGDVPQYGSLSRFDREQMLRTNREFDEDPDDPRKEQPLDFPVWKAAAPGEPSWSSPWGLGRPGWHIECSAMSEHHLGAPFELHGGGVDLIFPHHENELAQSAGYSGIYPFARTWMHAAVVTMGGIKMSKSLGNMAFARDLLRRYHPDALRLYLLGTHYRAPMEYREEDLAMAEALAERLRQATRARDRAGRRPDPRAEAGRAELLAALDDNLDTPRALATLRRLADAALADQARDDPSPALARAVVELGALLGLTLR